MVHWNAESLSMIFLPRQILWSSLRNKEYPKGLTFLYVDFEGIIQMIVLFNLYIARLGKNRT